MRLPLHLATDQLKSQIHHRLRGRSRFPYVLMLEPLYTCHLACLGCSIERHTGKLKDRLPLEECLRAVDESGAPTVSICGGEPTIYPELVELLEGIIELRRHIYLCTNALLLDTKLFGKIAPHKRLTINVHLDGMRETHDYVCAREGVFDKAVEMIREAKRLGYHVTTNTTVFKETDIEEIEELSFYVPGNIAKRENPSSGSYALSYKASIPKIRRAFEKIAEKNKYDLETDRGAFGTSYRFKKDRYRITVTVSKSFEPKGATLMIFAFKSSF